MYTQNSISGSTFYAELLYRRDVLITELDRQRDQPLATGDRVADSVRVYKGAWVMHMLRQMMFDLEKRSDRVFMKFLQELSSLINTGTFTNADFIRLAEKHAGIDLDPFFAVWLYGVGVPEFDVIYTIVPQGAEWNVNVSVTTTKVPESFTMPVTIQVGSEDGTRQFLRQTVNGKQTSFVLGPFTSQPKEVVFNEFASILSKDKVSKGKG